MHRAFSLGLACAITIVPAAAGAQSGARAPVDTLLTRRIDQLLLRAADSGFNGSVLIARKARVILQKEYGWADRQKSAPVTRSTPFWIASISKQFVAAAVLKLVEQGRVSLEDPIIRFFPAVPAEKTSITVHQLLTHTAGLQQNYAADGIADRALAIASILDQPLARPPGESFGYSNDGYTLIAAIVEIAAGKPYESYLREQLLAPAGLTHTGFWGPIDHPEVAAILGPPYANPAIARPNWGYRGAVGMFSTAADLYQWYLALSEGRILSAENRRLLLSPHVMRGTLGVGYGWFQSEGPHGSRAVWTRGYEGFGHGAVLATYPEAGVVIVVTTNSGEKSPDVPVSHQLAQELAALVLE
jgi:CubicO group peptidase (beta-lactamase class C family)